MFCLWAYAVAFHKLIDVRGLFLSVPEELFLNYEGFSQQKGRLWRRTERSDEGRCQCRLFFKIVLNRKESAPK